MALAIKDSVQHTHNAPSSTIGPLLVECRTVLRLSRRTSTHNGRANRLRLRCECMASRARRSSKWGGNGDGDSRSARDAARWFIGCEGLRCHTRRAAQTRIVAHGQVPFVRQRPRAARREANQTVGVSGRADVHQADAPWSTVADAAMSEPASAELERVCGGPRTVLMFHDVKKPVGVFLPIQSYPGRQ